MVNAKTLVVPIILILIIVIGAFVFIQSNSHNTKVEVISNSTLMNGDSVVIVLKDEYRNVYPDEKVHIKILDDSEWADNYDVVTDANGQASVQLSAFENGNYTIHTNYNGTLFNKPYHGVDSLVIYDGYSSFY